MMTSLPSNLYVDGVDYGSPAHLYGISRVSFITHVNNIETPDLDRFLEVVKKIPDNEFFRVNVVAGQQKKMVTLKKCNRYVSVSDFDEFC